jgi:hypothetical protein
MSRGKFLYAIGGFVPFTLKEKERIYKAGYDAEIKGEDYDEKMKKYSLKLERVLFMLGVVQARRDQWKKEGKICSTFFGTP